MRVARGCLLVLLFASVASAQNHAGLVCDTDGFGSPKTYTATYHATGGTRKYFAASGTGDVALVFDAADTLLHLDGSILFR